MPREVLSVDSVCGSVWGDPRADSGGSRSLLGWVSTAGIHTSGVDYDTTGA
jgi:hypothetical protein